MAEKGGAGVASVAQAWVLERPGEPDSLAGNHFGAEVGFESGAGRYLAGMIRRPPEGGAVRLWI